MNAQEMAHRIVRAIQHTRQNYDTYYNVEGENTNTFIISPNMVCCERDGQPVFTISDTSTGERWEFTGVKTYRGKSDA